MDQMEVKDFVVGCTYLIRHASFTPPGATAAVPADTVAVNILPPARAGHTDKQVAPPEGGDITKYLRVVRRSCRQAFLLPVDALLGAVILPSTQ